MNVEPSSAHYMAAETLVCENPRKDHDSSQSCPFLPIHSSEGVQKHSSSIQGGPSL